MELQTLEETFLAKATHEYEARLNDEQNVEKTNERVWKWGRTKNTDTVQNERQVSFKKYLSTLSRQLKLLSNSYQVIFKIIIITNKFLEIFCNVKRITKENDKNLFFRIVSKNFY